MFWACLTSSFTCCVTCCHCALKQLFFSPACTYLWLSTGTSACKFVVCCVYFECFSLLMLCACLISRFTCCVTCRHCALKQLFFPPACTYLWLSTGTSACKFVFCCVYFCLLMFWACCISCFTCCVTCRHCALKQPFFFLLHVHIMKFQQTAIDIIYDCLLELQWVSSLSVVCILKVLVS